MSMIINGGKMALFGLFKKRKEEDQPLDDVISAKTLEEIKKERMEKGITEEDEGKFIDKIKNLFGSFPLRKKQTN